MIKKKIIIYTILIFFCMSVSGSTIKVLKTRLLKDKDFLSQKITTLKRGDKVKIITKKGNWLYVNFNGKEGYIHKTTIGNFKSNLTGKKTGSNSRTSDKEIALAAKGFSESNEKKIRNRRNLYNFKALEWIMQTKVSVKMLRNFQKNGELK